MSTLLFPTDSCIGCKINQVPPPEGDIGSVFISGFVAAFQMERHKQGPLRNLLCPKHKIVHDTFMMLDTGLFNLLSR